MKRILMLIVAVLCVALPARSIPPPVVTIVPSEVVIGDTVTVTVSLTGNKSTDSKIITITCWAEYYEEIATKPIILPPSTANVLIAGVKAALIKSPTWKLDLPAAWAYVSDPASSGYLAASTARTATGLSFTATALLADITGSTVWQMRVLGP